MYPSSLLSSLHRVRRQITLSTVRAGLAYGARLSPRRTVALGRSLGRVAGMVLFLRERLKSNLRLAGLDPTPERVDRHFRLLGDWFAISLATYNRGLAKSGFAESIRFDDSISRLDRAIAQGRGAVLVSPHVICHELGAGVINRRHPVVALVRESKNPIRDAIKRRWYEATGLEVVLRSRKSSMLADVMSYVRVLRSGKILAITPDLPAVGGSAVLVNVLGRRVSLNPGMVTLAMWSGAPMVFCWPRRWEFMGYGPDIFTMSFDEPIQVAANGNRAEVLRSGTIEWARRFEEFLRRDPEYWLFWLDKRWTQVWRGEQ